MIQTEPPTMSVSISTPNAGANTLSVLSGAAVPALIYSAVLLVLTATSPDCLMTIDHAA